jgi:predicted transcriptional regulator
VLAVLAQRLSATAAELAQALGDNTKAGTESVWQALQRLLKRGAVIQDGRQYRLPA